MGRCYQRIPDISRQESETVTEGRADTFEPKQRLMTAHNLDTRIGQ